MALLRGWTPLIALQVGYSLLARTVEAELAPFAHDQGLALVPWSPLSFTSARRRRAVWLCAQGAWLCARRVRSAVQLCAEGGQPAVGSRRSGARKYWPGCPGPALAALPARWRRGPPAHGSGGFAPYGSPRPARPAPAPPYRQSPSPAAAPPTCCCLPRCWPAAPPAPCPDLDMLPPRPEAPAPHHQPAAR